jgi:hypothetical protein
MEKLFYRVCNTQTEQGLWYDAQGNFTGLIHDRFDFCKNNSLGMDYDPELRGYLSATPELEMLWHWFPKEDITKLEKHGWFIHEYAVEDYKFYDRFQHTIINQATSKLIRRIELSNLSV